MVGTITRHEIPRSIDEVDLDRLVWDPIYRDAVRHLIESDAPTDDGDDDGGGGSTRRDASARAAEPC